LKGVLPDRVRGLGKTEIVISSAEGKGKILGVVGWRDCTLIVTFQIGLLPKIV